MTRERVGSSWFNNRVVSPLVMASGATDRLAVRGRRTGAERTIPLHVLEVDGERYGVEEITGAERARLIDLYKERRAPDVSTNQNRTAVGAPVVSTNRACAPSARAPVGLFGGHLRHRRRQAVEVVHHAVEGGEVQRLRSV